MSLIIVFKKKTSIILSSWIRQSYPTQQKHVCEMITQRTQEHNTLTTTKEIIRAYEVLHRVFFQLYLNITALFYTHTHTHTHTHTNTL